MKRIDRLLGPNRQAVYSSLPADQQRDQSHQDEVDTLKIQDESSIDDVNNIVSLNMRIPSQSAFSQHQQPPVKPFDSRNIKLSYLQGETDTTAIDDGSIGSVQRLMNFVKAPNSPNISYYMLEQSKIFQRQRPRSSTGRVNPHARASRMISSNYASEERVKKSQQNLALKGGNATCNPDAVGGQTLQSNAAMMQDPYMQKKNFFSTNTLHGVQKHVQEMQNFLDEKILGEDGMRFRSVKQNARIAKKSRTRAFSALNTTTVRTNSKASVRRLKELQNQQQNSLKLNRTPSTQISINTMTQVPESIMQQAIFQPSTTNSQFQQSSRHQIHLNPQSSHLSFSTAGQQSRKQGNLLGNSNSILNTTAPNIKTRQLQSQKKFQDDLLSQLHIDLCQSNGKLLHQQMYEFSSSAQLHQRKLESQQSLVKLRDLQSNKVLEAIQKGQIEQSKFNRTQKNKLATELQQKEQAYETQYLPTSATRAHSQLSQSAVEIERPYSEVSFRSMVLQVPRTDDEIYKSLEQQEKESQRSNSAVRRSAFMSPTPHKTRKSARNVSSSRGKGKERLESGKTLIRQGKRIHYLVRKKNEEFKNVGPKKIKYEYNKFLHGMEFNLDRYMGCEYKLDDGRMIIPKRRVRTRRKRSKEVIKEPTPRPPTPKKQQLTEKERIDLKNKMFLETIKKIAPTCEDSDDIKEALDSDNHWKNLAGFSAFSIRLKMLRRMNQTDGHLEHLKNRQALVCQFFHDISRYLIKALLRQPSREVKYHEIGFKAFLDYIEFAQAEPQLFPELAYEILVADFHSLMLQLAADKEMMQMLEFFWQYLEKLAKTQTKENVEMLRRLKLADIMVAHILSAGKVSFRITQSITSVIQRALLERTAPKDVAHKLIECLLRAFNRQGEDKSIAFMPKEVELYWFEKEERKKRRKRKRIWDEYTQNKIDRNALWAMQGYCSYSYAHSISFLEAMEQRRTEFTRKCARILMDYADSKIEQEEDQNSDEEVKHKDETETPMSPKSSDSLDRDLTSEQLREQEIKEEDSDISYERQRKEEKAEQWANIVKPCLSLLARLNTVSDDFAHHFITGKQKSNFKDGQVVGITRVIHKEPRNVAKVIITDYLTKVSDVNAMRAGLHTLQMALLREFGGREQQVTLNKAQQQWRQVEHQVLANELYELFQSCKMVSRLPIILSAETAMNEGLDPVYAGYLLHFIRTLFKKTVDMKGNEQHMHCLLSLAKTVMQTLPQQITSMENGPTYKISRTHKTESAVREVINVLEYITEFDKGLIRQFFRVSDAYHLLNIAKLQYKSESSGLSYRVNTILRSCYRESGLSTPKEALFDLLTSPMSDKSKF